MSRLTGGIFGQPRGKTGGIVFSSARVKDGKIGTAKMLVKPANPKTEAQVANRSAFTNAVEIVKQIGYTIYQSAFNRSVGQLPGFQSLVSAYKSKMDSISGALTTLDEMNLGTLHFPDTFTATAGVDSCVFTWSTESGNGAATDLFCVIAVPTQASLMTGEFVVKSEYVAARSTGATGVTITMTDKFVYQAFFKSATTTSYSLCKTGQVTPL